MNKISNSPIKTNSYNPFVESTLTKTWNGLKLVSQKGIDCVSTTAGYVKNGVFKGIDLTHNGAKSFAQGIAVTGNSLYKATLITIDSTTYAGITAAAYLTSTLIKGKNSFIQNKELYLKELENISTSSSLMFFSFGVVANEILRVPLLSYLDGLGFAEAPDLPKPLYNFSRNAAILEKSMPSDEKNLCRLLINRPLLFGTLLFGLTQEGLLKQLPEKILKKVSPARAFVVNSKIAKVARVSLVAAIYSLSSSLNFVPYSILPDYVRHLDNLKNHITHSSLIWKFALGLVLGSIQEITGNPLYVISTLSGINLKYTMYEMSGRTPLILPEYRR